MRWLEDFIFGLVVALAIFVAGVQCGIYSAHQRDAEQKRSEEIWRQAQKTR